MSKIEELIKKLCPNGVEYKTIGELFDVKNGYTPSKNNKYFWENGNIPWFRMDDIRTNGNILNDATQHITELAIKNRKFSKDSLIVATTATIGVHALIKCDFVCNQQLTCVAIKEKLKNDLNIKFCFYYFDIIDEQCKKIANQGGGMPIVSLEKMKKLVFPVPPLEVQCEIVHILDDFTLLSELLSAELKARRKQYEYYKKTLFENKNIELKTLKELATNCDNKRKPITSGNREKGEYPYYGASGIVDYVKGYIFDGDYLLISEDGANLVARKTPIAFSISGKNWVNNHAHVLKFSNMYLQKYVEMYLNYINIEQYISGAAQPKLNQVNLNKIVIPIPNNDTLKNIVDILLKFDKITNDISEGLPAEIEARQKQYEYYRDKLLTFKELKVNE